MSSPFFNFVSQKKLLKPAETEQKGHILEKIEKKTLEKLLSTMTLPNLILFSIENSSEPSVLGILKEVKFNLHGSSFSWEMVQVAIKKEMFCVATELMNEFPSLLLFANIFDLEIICEKSRKYAYTDWPNNVNLKRCIEKILGSPALSNNSKACYEMISGSPLSYLYSEYVIRYIDLTNLTNVRALFTKIPEYEFDILTDRLVQEGFLFSKLNYSKLFFKFFIQKTSLKHIKILLKNGFDPRRIVKERNESNRHNLTPFHYAIQKNAYPIFYEMFFSKRFPPSFELKIDLLKFVTLFATPDHSIAFWDMIIQTLDFRKDDFDKKRKENILKATVFKSVKHGSWEKTMHWVKMFPFVVHEKVDGMALLHKSCNTGNASITNFLVSKKCNVFEEDSDGFSPLDYCLMLNYRAGCIKALFSEGARIPIDIVYDEGVEKWADPYPMETLVNIFKERNKRVLLLLLLNRKFNKDFFLFKEHFTLESFFRFLHFCRIDHVLPPRNCSPLKKGKQTLKKLKIEEN